MRPSSELLTFPFRDGVRLLDPVVVDWLNRDYLVLGHQIQDVTGQGWHEPATRERAEIVLRRCALYMPRRMLFGSPKK